MQYAAGETAWGWVAVAGGPAGLVALVLPRPEREGVVAELRARVPGPLVEDEEFFAGLLQELRDYFAGRQVTFSLEVDWTCLTRFQRVVSEVVKHIPYGETRSYKWVAECVRRPRACQAVGQALKINPVPLVIPCHRVVNLKAGLGGYSAGGEEVKRRLLELEGVELPP